MRLSRRRPYSPLAYLAIRQVSHDVAPRAAKSLALAKAEDATLATALIEKDPSAPREVWTRFAPLVRRILRRSLGPQHDVEDLVQDVFLCLFQRVHTLREPGAIKSFVIGITVRTVRYEIRKARVRRWISLSHTADLPDLRAVTTDNDSQHALIHFYRALARINERDRAAFVLHFIEGMDAPEVAAALEVSVPTARRCFNRARARVTLFAQRDPFLVDYLSAIDATSTEAAHEPA